MDRNLTMEPSADGKFEKRDIEQTKNSTNLKSGGPSVALLKR